MFLILPIGTIAFSAIALIIGALVTGGPNLAEPDALQNWLTEIAKGPLGILILVAPGQIFFLVLSLGSALPSSEPLTKRLGITAPRYSPRTWALLCLGTPVVQILSLLFAQLFFDLSEPSEHMEMLSGLFTGQEGVLGITLLVLFAAVMPGITEELFFRGYVRVGLGRRFGFVVAIFVPALIFALVHGDPMHATAVLPLGLWFGCLAWWSRSVIPPMIAHFVNNLFAIFSARYATALEAERGDLEPAVDAAASPLSEMTTMVVSAYALCFFMLLAGLYCLIRERARQQVTSTS
jgi:membrane protease YdiL (CAAX protease family)